MLRSIEPSAIKPFLDGSPLRRAFLTQARASACFQFDAAGKPAAFGGFCGLGDYEECWLVAGDRLKGNGPALLKLVRALRAEIARRKKTLIAHVLDGHAPGRRLMTLLGFSPHGPSPIDEGAELWVRFPKTQNRPRT